MVTERQGLSADDSMRGKPGSCPSSHRDPNVHSGLSGAGCSFGRRPMLQAITDLEDRLRILDALYIPTRYPDSLPDGAPTDHFGRLQSEDALNHAREIVDGIGDALA